MRLGRDAKIQSKEHAGQPSDSFLLLALQLLLYLAFRLLHHLARHLLYQLTPVLFAYRLELLLLLLIQERGNFGIDFVGDLLQLLQLLQWT